MAEVEQRSGTLHNASNRETVKEFLNKNAHNGDIVTIMGARDNSLSDFAAGLCD